MHYHHKNKSTWSWMFSNLHSGAVRDLAICKNNHPNSITATSTVKYNFKQHITLCFYYALCCCLSLIRRLAKHARVFIGRCCRRYRRYTVICCARVTGLLSVVYCDGTVYQIIFWKLSSLKCRLRGVFSLLHRGLQHFMALPHVC